MLLKDLYHYYLIKRSELFDVHFYLQNYPDVRQMDVDPLWHFLRFGWKEGRNPSSSFNTLLYLQKFEDVKENNFNPLVHYIRYGKAEGRFTSPIQDSLEDTDIVPKITIFYKNPLSEYLLQASTNQSDSFTWTKTLNEEQSLKILSYSEALSGIIQTLKFNNYVLSLSHDNYLKVIAGVQISIAHQQQLSNTQGLGYIHIYPHQEMPILVNEDKDLYIDLILDGQFIGTLRGNDLIQIFSVLPIPIDKVIIHHTMGFNMGFITNILDSVENNPQKLFMLHDFFSTCPNYFLLRNDIEYCHAPDVDSNACNICLYGDLRKKQYFQFKTLFDRFGFEIVAPSEFALSFWKRKSGFSAKKYHIIPHVNLEWKENIKLKESHNNRPIRVAYIGYPVFHKGWEVFNQLTANLKDNPRYQFFQFSITEKAGNFQFIKVNVTCDDRLKMIRELINNRIDVAILWSLVPETFSYTLFEALAAGCFIITNPNSGNIQNYLHENPDRGLVLKNEQLLYDVFINNEITGLVRDYQKEGKPAAVFVINTKRII